MKNVQIPAELTSIMVSLLSVVIRPRYVIIPKMYSNFMPKKMIIPIVSY